MEGPDVGSLIGDDFTEAPAMPISAHGHFGVIVSAGKFQASELSLSRY
jgi:hypothetical protein